MIKHDEGLNGIKYSDLAKEFLAKMRDNKSDKTPYNAIQSKHDRLSTPKSAREFLAFLLANNSFWIDKLILLDPLEFEQTHDLLTKKCKDLGLLGSTKKQKKWIKELENLFGYESFDTTVGRRWFLEHLAIKVCPYCNISIFMEVPSMANPSKKLFLLEIDHFYKKATHPWFSISFFNLVPSCLICNQRLKGKAKISATSHLHPFEDSFDDYATFVPQPDVKLLPIEFKEITIEYRDLPSIHRARRIGELFRLKELYQYFVPEIEHLRSILQLVEEDPKREPFRCGDIVVSTSKSETEKLLEGLRIPKNKSEIRNYSLGKLKLDCFILFSDRVK